MDWPSFMTGATAGAWLIVAVLLTLYLADE